MSEISTDAIAEILETVDPQTRVRAASLSARGLLDGQIADILLLTPQQMVAIKTSAEYRKQYAEAADEAIQKQLDLEEGWDSLEEQTLTMLLEGVKFNRDPKFLLLMARTANAAERRSSKKNAEHKVVDASTNINNNVLVFNLNKNYINKNAESKTIDVTPRPEQIPLKQSDVPAPKLVDALLLDAETVSFDRSLQKEMEKDLEEMIKASGVKFDQA